MTRILLNLKKCSTKANHLLRAGVIKFFKELITYSNNLKSHFRIMAQINEASVPKAASAKNAVLSRTVSTLCGSWRGDEKDGGLIFVFDKRRPCLSPEPSDERYFPEKVVDFWVASSKDGIEDQYVCRVDDTEERPVSSGEKRKADDGNIEKSSKKIKLIRKGTQVIRPGFDENRYDETSYYIENGLRKVFPYYFTFTTYAKGRWVGKQLLDVFSKEFRAYPIEEYERCIASGSLTINNEKVPPDYEMQHNDFLSNIVHRHEVPVTSQPITFVHIDEDLVVVDKPASIPVHPCGRYRHNTVVFILAKEYNLKNLLTIHRVDRLTSGLLLFGRNPKKARHLEQQIRDRQVLKEYVCRVDGEFPEEEIECKEPIEVVSYKIGVCRVSANGKDCSTTFKRLGYNRKTNTSVLLCRPKTGRMHQIRVHLQYLGYPIVSDPLYNHPVFGPLRGKGGDIGDKTEEQLVSEMIVLHNTEKWLGEDLDARGVVSVSASTVDSATKRNDSTVPKCNGADTGNIKRHKSTQTGCTPPMTDPAEIAAVQVSVDPNCYECKIKYRDPSPSDLVMYLHAWRYKGLDWEYETQLPDWTNVDWEPTNLQQ